MGLDTLSPSLVITRLLIPKSIPMAKAEKRIILVGDHRQLPHMLEEEVERKLAASNEQSLATFRT